MNIKVEIVSVSFKFLLCSFLQPGQLMVGELLRKLTPYLICSEHRGFPHRAQVAVADFPHTVHSDI